MKYKEVDYFDHDADIGIIGRGETMVCAFSNAAYAMFNIMSDIAQVPRHKTIKISFKEPDIELGLVVWLNLLLAKAHEFDMIFSSFELSRNKDLWTGTASGDYWQESYIRGTEVKGATLTMLAVSHNSYWEARCVVDV